MSANTLMCLNPAVRHVGRVYVCAMYKRSDLSVRLSLISCSYKSSTKRYFNDPAGGYLALDIR